MYCSLDILTFRRLSWFPSSLCSSSMVGDNRVRVEIEDGETTRKRVF